MRLLLASTLIFFNIISPIFFGKTSNQDQIPTPYDLIAAVNALRASHGMPPYAIDPLLMLSAQTQADYLASQAPGPVSGHVGPGGTDADARAQAVGFPYVAGLDINENWAAMPVGTSFEELFNDTWSDAAHQHTMLHQFGQLVGAGIAQSGNSLYIILDVAAYWGDAHLTPWPTTAIGPSGMVLSQYVAPVMMATPRADGSIVHQVQSGQSLWSIAIKYGISIDTIRRLNNIGANGMIYIGQKLLIQPPGSITPVPFEKTSTPSAVDYELPQMSTPVFMMQPTLTQENSSPLLIDQNVIFLILFILGGAGIILIFIGLRH